MQKQTKSLVSRIFLCSGIGLLVVTAVALLLWNWGVHSSQKKAASYVSTIRALIPEPQGAALEERSNNTMSALSIDGTNFVGIVEMPKYDSSLPVCGDWGKVTKYPCHFSGSIYDRSMQIGATTQAGQYDFYREISVGDSLLYTDMEGNRFSYTVSDIRYKNHADQTALQQENAALTLFIKNIYAFEYIIIFCDISE